MSLTTNNIGFIGAGNMATALISGLIESGYDNKKIYSSSPEEDHLKRLSDNFSINVSNMNKEIFKSASTVVFAVKPNVINEVIKENSDLILELKPLIISIVAGFQILEMEKRIGSRHKIIRAMPNTPASIRMGVTALTSNNLIGTEDKEKAETIFGSVGTTCWLNEESFDLFTSLISSGPAYIFYLVEALTKAAENLKLKESLTKKLIVEMIKGSATLAGVSEDSPSILRKKVTSPGGVTERALEVLKEKKVKEHLVEAIFEGASRSKSLGKK
tara:strand:+ start:528 stop:1346 length:819 start_codon:yes stop_codon:yes gene_type:complete